MDKWDRDNLNFLLSLSPAEFLQFMNDSSDDDLAYALELVQQEKAKVLNKMEELCDSILDDSMDLTQAQTVLARFRL